MNEKDLGRLREALIGVTTLLNKVYALIEHGAEGDGILRLKAELEDARWNLLDAELDLEKLSGS